MKAYPSGWQAALQGLSDTLGGTAEFQRDTQTIKARQSLAEQELSQRQQEEQRRQRAFDLELKQAEQAYNTQQAQRQFTMGQAQDELGRRRQEIFEQMAGGPATVGQQREMEKLEFLTRNLSPENSEALLKDVRKQRATDAGTRALQGFGQEIVRPITEGSLQDPEAQQGLQLLSQVAQQMGQSLQVGAFEPDDLPVLMDKLMGQRDDILKGSAKRMADLQMRQATQQVIGQHMQGILPGDPRGKKLAEMQQLVGLGLMDDRQVGVELLKPMLGIPEENMTAFDTKLKELVEEASRPALMHPADAIANVAQVLGMNRPQVNGQAQSVPRGKLVQFREAIRASPDKSPQALRAIGESLGITDWTPEEEEFLFGR